MQRLSSPCSAALNSSTHVGRHVQRSSARQAGRQLTHIQESSFINGHRISLKHEQTRDVLCQGLFGLGAPELAVIAGVVALIYGTILILNVFVMFLWRANAMTLPFGGV